MVEALVNFFRNIIPGELTVFILSMMPIIELRGGLVAAKMLGVDLLPARKRSRIRLKRGQNTVRSE